VRKAVHILRILQEAVGWAKLPEEIQSLLRAALKHVFLWGSFALIAFHGWWREAPFEQMATSGNPQHYGSCGSLLCRVWAWHSPRHMSSIGSGFTGSGGG
jgi:hypothetical protein